MVDETLPLHSAVSVPLAVVVRVLDAPAQPSSFVLRPGVECTIGSASSDITITSPTVSRVHVELSVVPEGVRVRDVGSRNGTFYLGQKIVEAVLSPSATLQLGSVHVGLSVHAEGLRLVRRLQSLRT